MAAPIDLRVMSVQPSGTEDDVVSSGVGDIEDDGFAVGTNVHPDMGFMGNWTTHYRASIDGVQGTSLALPGEGDRLIEDAMSM